jgi:hypothetical protein
MHQIQPTVGQWYLRPDTGHKFEVIDIDDGDGVIEVQDEEGTLDQIDSDTWFAETLEATDQPQNAIGAFDNLSEPDDADGGDPVDIDALDTDPLRVASDELLDDVADPDVAGAFNEEDDVVQEDLDEEDEQ